MKTRFINKALLIAAKSNIKQAIQLQKYLNKYIYFEENLSDSINIGGVDISYKQDTGCCALIMINCRTMEVVENSFSRKKIRFPYIPGLLFYREFPVFFDAYKKLKTKPDLLIFDGHGLSHQRMMGIATMAGILLDIPTIGCAKSHLFGDYKIPDNEKFASSELLVKGMNIGYVLRSKENIKPIFISSGYRISPKCALEIVKKLITKYKLPLPVHLAHTNCESMKLKK